MQQTVSRPGTFAPAGIKVAIPIRVSYDAPEGMNQKKVVAERLGEMLEEFGSWVEYYRVRLDEEVLVVAFDLCSSSMIMEQLLLGGDISCLTDLLTAIKRHLAAEQKHLLFDPILDPTSHQAPTSKLEPHGMPSKCCFHHPLSDVMRRSGR